MMKPPANPAIRVHPRLNSRVAVRLQALCRVRRFPAREAVGGDLPAAQILIVRCM